MKRRRWLVVVCSILLLAIAATLYALPTTARHVAIARLHAITKRPVSIDRVDIRLLSGRFAIHGLRVAEPDGTAPFADCELLDVRLNVLSLLRGHIWARELVVRYLSGAVESEDQKAKAETVARTVPGVKRVVSTLEVRRRPE